MIHMSYIEIRGVTKTFINANKEETQVLKGIDLDIKKGDIYGIIGFSGAGKSTLIRCINGLDKPDSGSIKINGKEVTALDEKGLMALREKIGMIFQHFNLLRSKNVYDNIALPLRYKKKSSDAIRDKVDELLRIVGLTEKKKSFPSQLSGGQKQRVAIARSLAAEPAILLSDEATSALDPQTTDSILDLLAVLNQKLGITIILITHQMNVIQRICNKVAIIDDGRIVEKGSTFEVFSHPKQRITKKFLESIFRAPSEKEIRELQKESPEDEILHLIFTGNKAKQSVISDVTRSHHVDINILYGSIEYVGDQPIGSLFVTVHGNPFDILSAKKSLQNYSVEIEDLRGDPDDTAAIA